MAVESGELLLAGAAFGEDMEIDFSQVEQLKEIGRGSFGVVYRGVWQGKDVSVKKINSTAEYKALMGEVRQLSRFCHPNIIKLYGASTKKPACLVMELAEASLYDVLYCQPRIQYTAHHAMSWALQCAEGVAYLHAMKPRAIIHRDLKPPNLLLMMEGRVLKICDFGTACDMRTRMTNSQGSAAWMAPEVFASEIYTEKCDVFSWSIILWELITRQKPYSHITDLALRLMWAVHNGERPPLIQGCPKSVEVLMTSCWDHDPEKRPSMEAVVREMSRLFQVFPAQVQPLDYAGHSDIVEESNSLENGDDSPYGSPPLTCESLQSRAVWQEMTPSCSIAEPIPARVMMMPTNLSAMAPLHIDTDPVQTIPTLAEDFLHSSSRQQQQQQQQQLAILRYPHHHQQPQQQRHQHIMKRRSAEVTPTTPLAGHRRSSSQGNPCLWPELQLRHRQDLDDTATSANLLSETAFVEQPLEDVFRLLHPSLRPVPPCTTSHTSMKVYEEHAMMAKEYLKVQHELKWLTQYCKELVDQLERTKEQQRFQAEQQLQQQQQQLSNRCDSPTQLQKSVEEYVRLQDEKESLVQLHRSLKEQLTRLRYQQDHQQQQLTDDGWVVLSRT